MRRLSLLLVSFLLALFLLLPPIASAHVFQIPVVHVSNTYSAEGLYRVYFLNGSPYFVLIAGTNFTVFEPSGLDYTVGMGFLNVCSTPLGIVTLSKYYVYLNMAPIMESDQGFVSGGANGNYVWAVLSNGSVMVWTPSKGYTSYVYGVPRGSLFFKNFTAYVNGSLEYLPVFYLKSINFQEYFFTFINAALGSSINLTKANFYHVFVSYTVPVKFGFIGDSPYFLGYNITTNETIAFYSGKLEAFKGLPVSLINYPVPAYLVRIDGSKYAVIFANGTSFNFTLSGTPSFFVYGKTIYIYGINKSKSGNFTEVVQVFGPSKTFNVSSPINASFTNRSLVLKALTPNGYVTVLNLNLNTTMRLVDLFYDPSNRAWVVYLAYPNSNQIVTVVVTGVSATAKIPKETFVYPNENSDPLVYYGFKVPSLTAYLYPSTQAEGTPSSSPIFYAIIVIVVSVVLVYAGVSFGRRKR